MQVSQVLPHQTLENTAILGLFLSLLQLSSQKCGRFIDQTDTGVLHILYSSQRILCSLWY